MNRQSKMAPSARRSLNGTRVRRIPGREPKINLNRIATWNVKTLFKAGQLATVALEMERLEVDILGLSEVRWPDAGQHSQEKFIMYYSGCNNGEHKNGVGIMIKKEMRQYVTNFVPYNDRMMLIQLNAHPLNINLIQIYAPTSNSTDNEIEEFYSDLEMLVKNLKKHDVNIIMGDFNAKIGKGKVENIVGNFGLGLRNERGGRLV